MLPWHKDVLLTLENYCPEIIQSDTYTLVGLNTNELMLNLVSLENNFLPGDFIRLQQDYHENSIQLFHLWEDIWYTRKAQVVGRIQSMSGLNTRIHARKTRVLAISQPQADAFLMVNHIQASAKSRYKLALSHDDNIVAVACFSNLRLMRGVSSGHRSAEVIRFASAVGVTVIGGFSKLLKHFIAQHCPDDIMSYADRDWSLGKAYEQSGFELAEITPPSEIRVDQDTFERYFLHRVPMNGRFIRAFNTGNLKYIYNV